MRESTWLVDTSLSSFACCHWIQPSGASVTTRSVPITTNQWRHSQRDRLVDSDGLLAITGYPMP